MAKPPHTTAIANIVRWAQRDPWADRLKELLDEHLGLVLEEFGLTNETLMELVDPEYMSIFGCVFEDFMTCDFEPDGDNVVDAYVKRRGWHESPLGRKYLQAIRTSTLSIYEVVAAEPGSHYMARDLVRGGEPVRVKDKLASESVVRWDRLAARLITLGDEVQMTGGTLPLEFDLAEEMLADIADSRRRMRRALRPLARRAGKSLDEAESVLMQSVLGDAAPLIVSSYVARLIARSRNPRLPSLVNTDGDEIVFSETRFPLADPASVDEVEARIDRIADLERHGHSERSWSWLAPPYVEAPVAAGSGEGLRLAARRSDGRTSLASIRLDGERVIVETNSTARAERCRTLLAEALGTLVGTPLTATRSSEQALSELALKAPNERRREPFVPPAEAKEVMRTVLDRHYEEALSKPVPMLGGKSPRQLVRSKAGKQKAADWLKYMENQTLRAGESSGVANYDFTWMWKDLGIAHLRQ